VGGGIPLATGAGLSAQVLGDGRVSLCFFGDGAANQGTFHECLNMASVWKLPVVYFCENNQYAATTPLALSHSVTDIALRAGAYAIPGETVDGQDLFAVHEVTTRAVARARKGEGPTLIEAKTYRYDEHAVNLFIPAQYRSEEEMALWRARDPLDLLRARLAAEGVVQEEQLQELERVTREEVAAAVEHATRSAEPDFESVFEHLYSNPIHPAPELR
jgi:pyruvate dehydrogenase E1 component alpha subunit